jgi:hypothetical protein
VNLIPYLKGTNQGAPHEYLFWRHFDQKNYAVIHQSGFKQVVIRDSAFSLYNLKTDIEEKTNIDNKKMMGVFEEKRKEWEANTIAPIFFGLNQEELYELEKKSKQKHN